MAENSSAQEKTEKATPKRLKDARKKGQIARSKELTTLVLVGASGLGVLAMGGWTAQRMAIWMEGALSVDAQTIANQPMFDSLAHVQADLEIALAMSSQDEVEAWLEESERFDDGHHGHVH